MKLKVDIYNTGKKKYLIAKTGDAIDLVSDRGNVLIVQHGLRKFPIKRENVEFPQEAKIKETLNKSYSSFSAPE